MYCSTGDPCLRDFYIMTLIQGNNREAEKIQEEFGLTMYEVAKGTPVISHGIAAGHAFAGEWSGIQNTYYGFFKLDF